MSVGTEKKVMLLGSINEKEGLSSYQRIQLSGYFKIAALRSSIHLPMTMDN